MAMMQCSLQRTQNNWRLPCELAQDFAPVQNVLGQQAFHSRPWPSPRRSKIPITAAQKPELRVQCGPTSRSKPGCRERNFWMQRRSAKNRHSNSQTPAETKVREVSGRKSPQNRPIWRRLGKWWFAKTGWWWKQSYANPSPSNSLLNRERTGKFLLFLAALSVFGDHCDLNSSTCCRFP